VGDHVQVSKPAHIATSSPGFAATGTINPTSASNQKLADALKQITSSSREERPDTGEVRIYFKIYEHGVWRVSDAPWVDPSEPGFVLRMAQKYERKGIKVADTKGRMLVPKTCFEDVIANGTNTLVLIPEWEIDTDKQLPPPVTEEPHQEPDESEEDFEEIPPTPIPAPKRSKKNKVKPEVKTGVETGVKSEIKRKEAVLPTDRPDVAMMQMEQMTEKDLLKAGDDSSESEL
jgi:hypothetical protein